MIQAKIQIYGGLVMYAFKSRKCYLGLYTKEIKTTISEGHFVWFRGRRAGVLAPPSVYLCTFDLHLYLVLL